MPSRSRARRHSPALVQHLPDMPFDQIARHSMDFWLQSEDLPIPDNRVYYRDGQVHLDVDAHQSGGARSG